MKVVCTPGKERECRNHLESHLTDRSLLAKKLGNIETYVHEIEALGRPEELQSDLREQRFILYTLQITIGEVLDVASHIVSDERLGAPSSPCELIDLLECHGWLSEEVATPLRSLAGLRNILVHGYETLDLGIVEEIVEHRLDDLLAFVRAIRARL